MKASMTILSLVILFTPYPAAAQSLFAEGLQFPQRLIFTPRGNLLVSEGGASTPNNGRVSILDRQANRRSLLEGLPAGPGHGIPAFGPTGMGLDGRTLYLLVGEGDVMVGPPFTINLNGPSSPIFHSVLRIEFSAEVDAIASSFRLTPGNHWALADGYDLVLTNTEGASATVHLLTTFRPLVRNILGGAAIQRPSDPYGVWLDANNRALYIADPSAETLVRVNTVTGRSLVLTRFQPDERATPTGATFVDSVPTAACPVGDSFLVSFLSGAPFPLGASSVRLWRPSDGGWSRLAPLVGGLTMTNDMICLPGGTPSVPRVVTVEYSTTIDRTLPSGRVQFFDGSQRRILAQNLLLPTGVTQDPTTGDLFVATLTGSIFRMPLP
jgi:hypothetical protein